MWSRILAAAEELYPGSFALVMATGALSIAFDLLQYAWVSRALFVLNAAAYGVLWCSSRCGSHGSATASLPISPIMRVRRGSSR
ncbi:MAG TPA: hypothetical protein VN730_03395 [Steroidobacteraceae bacterium]|nr:hypothetical protein [Steroidobacteraceae bacterium]